MNAPTLDDRYAPTFCPYCDRRVCDVERGAQSVRVRCPRCRVVVIAFVRECYTAAAR